MSLKWKILSWVLKDKWGFPGGPDGKESACNARDLGSIPGSVRSLGEQNGYPTQRGDASWFPGPRVKGAGRSLASPRLPAGASTAWAGRSPKQWPASDGA